MLTLEEAKKLSRKKWEVIVNDGGFDCGVEKILPELTDMRSNCPMCEYHHNVKNAKCATCLYDRVCVEEYGSWVCNNSEHTAKLVLNAIIKRNEED